ncbi:hypothetical protein L6164_018338 [Bauhinia variegata]|uniref:Uncharacterized protein n=1 Tax=Bauhinia variegata TaxID=167791 RepID=A0ACB9NCM3_BAUVA|nr:hypothetical protein L6164_018338 [Bauhinia variegata]
MLGNSKVAVLKTRILECWGSVFLRFTFHNEEKLTLSSTLNFSGYFERSVKEAFTSMPFDDNILSHNG